jgi:uncharacterized membrane-anchored protein
VVERLSIRGDFVAKRVAFSAGVVVFGLLAFSCLDARAAASSRRPTTPEEFEASLGYQTGTIALSGGLATLRLPPSFRYINPESARRLLTVAWDNPPGTADGTLGMLIPAGVSPLSPDGWGIVITYDEDGFVNDDDARSLDYAKLLKEMQESAAARNAEREEEGFEPVTLVGWAEPPSYDAATHKLYWAKELVFGSESEHTLNYSIRVLGRRGVLVLNAVAGMNQLPLIRSQTQGVLAAVEFNEGHRYRDYLPGTDKAAAYGLTGLIVGATAAKAGFFKVLLAGILAFKKAVIVGVVALAAAIKRFFARGSKQAEPENA